MPAIPQEPITLTVFLPFASFQMRQPPKIDCPGAAPCARSAVCFVFRTPGAPR